MRILSLVFVIQSAMAAWFSASFSGYNDPTMPNALVKGRVYMRWDSAGSSNNAMLTIYDSPGNLRELIHQGKQTRYRFCNNNGNCDAETYKVKVQPPVKGAYSGCSGSYTIDGKTAQRCSKSASNDDEIKYAFFAGDTLVRWQFKNGRTWDFTKQSTGAHGVGLGVPGGCPAPRCTRMIDLLINIDDSGSISSSEWKTLVSYVNTIVGKFEVANDATMIGVTFFTNTGRVIRSLSGSASTVKNSVKNASRRWGNTCVGAGIRVGFNSILNKASATRKALNPKKIVISITDGVDTQCSSSNTASAVMNSFRSKATFIAVGVGNGVTKSNLKKVATSGSYVIQSGSFDGLSNTINSLVSTTCQDLPAMNPCGKSCKGFCNCNKQCVCPTCRQLNLCTVYKCSSGNAGCIATARSCTNSNKCKKNEGCHNSKPNNVWNWNSNTGCALSDIPEPAVSANDECKIGSCAPSTGWTYTTRVCPLAADPVCNLTRCLPNKKGGCDYYPRVCDDSNKCTIDTCRPGYGCVFTPVVCNDKNACTDDYCDRADGKCKATPWDVPVRCNDNNKCTDEHCDPASGCYHTRHDCKADFTNMTDDDWKCTITRCDKNTGCSLVVITGCASCDVTCDNSNPCAPQYPAFDANGDCYCKTEPVSCDDGDACTTDTCNPNTGKCEYTKKTPDEPGDACNPKVCNPATGKFDTVPVECSVDNLCLDYKCVVDSSYSNGYYCEEKPKCAEKPCFTMSCDQTDGECKYDEVACDPMPCNTVKCNAETGRCEYTPMTEPPADFEYNKNCQIPVCDPDNGWHVTEKVCPNEDPCVLAFCDPNAENGDDPCVYSTPCNDNDWCTDDTCDAVALQAAPDKDAEGVFTYVYETVNGSEYLTYYELTCLYTPKSAPDGFLAGTESCFEAVCHNDTASWSKKVLDEAFTDPCGACVEDYDQYYEGDTQGGCAALTNREYAKALGGVAVAGIAVAAIIGAAVVAVSGVFGTKELVARSAQAAGASVQNNPFYKENANEMVNPTFEGTDGFNY